MNQFDYAAEYATDTPVPVGSVVIYHGSIESQYGEPFRVVDNHGTGFPGSLALGQ